MNKQVNSISQKEQQGQKDFFQKLIEHNFDAFMVSDDDGIIMYTNPSVERITGYTPEELMGIHQASLLHPEDQNIMAQTLAEALKEPGVAVLAQWRMQHKDRTWRWLDGTLTNFLHVPGINSVVTSFRDISERKKAENLLEESELRFRSIIEQFPHPIVTYSPDGTATGANLAWEVMWQDKRDNAKGYNIRKDPQMIASGLSRYVERAFAGESVLSEAYEYDPALIGKQGRKRWIQMVLYPLKDTQDELLEVILILQDITASKLTEHLLNKSKERLENILQGIADAFVSLDKQWRYTFVNNQALQLMAKSREELLGKTLWEVFPDTVDTLFDTEYHRVMHERVSTRFETYFSSYSMWLEVRSYPHEDGIAIFYTNITDQKKAEEAIRNAETNYREIFDKASDAIFIHDMETGRVLDVNQKACEMTGFTKEEILNGNPGNFMANTPGFTPRDAMRYMQKAANEGSQIFEWRGRRKDGSLHWLEVSLNRATIAGAGRILAFFRQIEDRKKAEEEIQLLNQNLEQKVSERTNELEIANKELEAFSYSVSHDLRAPLRAIRGYMTILSEEHNRLDPEAEKLTNLVLNSARQMEQLIDDLLKFSRLGKRELSKMNISMKDMVDSIWEELKKIEGSRSIEWIAQDIPDAYADQTTIRQVWINLISNAIKYTRQREKAVIEIGSEMKENTTIYYIRDNGAGFNMRYYNKLFSIFQRLHIQKEFEGTGVGLAIVERVIQRHGGMIWATAKPDEGATFYFSLTRPPDDAGIS